MNDFISRIADSSQIGEAIDRVFSESEILAYFSNQASPVPLLLAILLSLMAVGIIFRFLHGHDNLINQTISCVFQITTLYIIAILAYSFVPADIRPVFSKLPFASFRDELIIIDPFFDTDITLLCNSILSITILCFCACLCDKLLCHGKSPFLWIPARLLSIIAAVFLFLITSQLLHQQLGESLTQYASFILLIILGTAILIGLFNPLLCVVFTVVNPFLGLLYTFFFSSLVGKQITSSVFSSVILCILLYVFERLGYSVWNISGNTLIYWIIGLIVLVGFSYTFDTKIRK